MQIFVWQANTRLIEKLRKYLSGGKYWPGTKKRNYYLYLLWIVVQGVKYL